MNIASNRTEIILQYKLGNKLDSNHCQLKCVFIFPPKGVASTPLFKNAFILWSWFRKPKCLIPASSTLAPQIALRLLKTSTVCSCLRGSVSTGAPRHKEREPKRDFLPTGCRWRWKTPGFLLSIQRHTLLRPPWWVASPPDPKKDELQLWCRSGCPRVRPIPTSYDTAEIPHFTE